MAAFHWSGDLWVEYEQFVLFEAPEVLLHLLLPLAGEAFMQLANEFVFYVSAVFQLDYVDFLQLACFSMLGLLICVALCDFFSIHLAIFTAASALPLLWLW